VTASRIVENSDASDFELMRRTGCESPDSESGVRTGMLEPDALSLDTGGS
jgi:hypothetical protein